MEDTLISLYCIVDDFCKKCKEFLTCPYCTVSQYGEHLIVTNYAVSRCRNAFKNVFEQFKETDDSSSVQ